MTRYFRVVDDIIALTHNTGESNSILANFGGKKKKKKKIRNL